MQQGKKSAGHPVDVASGTVYSTHADIAPISGKFWLEWERRYSTALLTMPPGPFGPGWTNCYFAALTKDKDEFRFLTPEGGIEIFADREGIVDNGGVVRNFGTFQELAKRKHEYVVTRWDVDTGDIERYVFKIGKKGEAWPLASIEDVTGQGLDLHYDHLGRLRGIQQRLEKRTLFLEYDSQNHISSVNFLLPHDQRQTLARYEYDRHGRLSAAYDALNHVDRYEYDDHARMTREIVKDGGVFFFRYDEKGRCTKTSGLDRYDEKTFRYYENIGWTEVTDSLGHVWRFQWTPTGQVEKTISPLGAIHSTKFDDYGRIMQEVEPNGAVTKYSYDEAGNMSEFINALGNVVRYEYNERHQTVKIIDLAQNEWLREYDEHGRMTAMGDPLGNWWRYRHDHVGNMIEVQNPYGASMKLHYNSAGDEIERTNWQGLITERKQCDWHGRVIKWSDALGNDVIIEYDALSRIKMVQWPDGTSTRSTYDAGSNLLTVTDGNGGVTRYRNGSCGLLQAKQDSLGAEVKFVWGTEPGQLLEVHNENGEIYRFEYDQEGQLVKEVGFDGTTKTYEYDLAGHCSAVTNELNEKTLFVRDVLGQLVRKIMPDGNEASFEYDPLGQMTLAANAACKIGFEYDALGQLLKEHQLNDTIETSYDLWGNEAQVQTSRGLGLAFQYDENGLPRSLTLGNGQRIEFRHNDVELEEQRLLPGGIEVLSEYDAAGRLLTRRAEEESPADNPNNEAEAKRRYHFQYDRAGNLIQQQSKDGSVAYLYDSLGQLLSRQPSGGPSENFRYDLAGNIISRESTPWTYGPGNRLLKSNDSIEYEYDRNGQLAQKFVRSASGDQVWKYRFNGAGELIEVTNPMGAVTSFAYDPLGRRIEKRFGGEVTRFIWKGDVLIHEIREDKDKIDYIFKSGSFEPIAQINDGVSYFYLVDHIGAPRELFGADGNLAWSANYRAWGQLDNLTKNSAETFIRFPGQYFDAETGLCYNRFRYYDPEIGRYISPDPLGLEGGINLYRYAINPIWWIDPFGLGVSENAANGDRREATRARQLKKNYPNDSVQAEQYLRDSNGRIVKDRVTGEGRRIDYAVIDQNGSRVRRLEEVTSPTASKVAQSLKEGRIRARGGTYIRDRRTGKLVKIGKRQRVHCTRMK